MLLFFLLTNVFAERPNLSSNNYGEPSESIIVVDSRYEEIYVEPARVFGETEDQKFNGDSQIFTYINMFKHLYDKNLSIYNKQNIKYAYEDCNYLEDALKCGIENNHWTLVTNVYIGGEQSTINFQLYDEIGLIIGQSTISKSKRIRYIKDITTTSQTNSRANKGYSISTQPNCGTKSCSPSRNYQLDGYGIPGKQILTEERPSIKEIIPPQITDKDLHQASMMLYLSIK